MGYLLYCEECAKIGYQKCLGEVMDDGQGVVQLLWQKNWDKEKDADIAWRQTRTILKTGMIVCEKHQTAGFAVDNGTVIAKIPVTKFLWTEVVGSTVGSVVQGSII